jgi:hypothetical protein
MLKSFCDICKADQKIKRYGLWLHNSDPMAIASPEFYYGSNNRNNPESLLFKDLCENCHGEFMKRTRSAIQEEIKKMEKLA